MGPGSTIKKGSSRRVRLLIAENDALVRRWLAAGVDSDRVDLRFVDCADAVAATREGRPDCVVVDAVSCLQDEIPLWERLAGAADEAPPVLVYASSDRWRSAAELARGPRTEYLPRPFSPQMLVEAAMRLVDRGGSTPRSSRPAQVGGWPMAAEAAV